MKRLLKRLIKKAGAFAVFASLTASIFATSVFAMNNPMHQHGFGQGDGRSQPIGINDFHTDVWERFSFNYNFSSGPDYRFELGRPTQTDLLPHVPANDNVRRNAGSAFNPPPGGMFSGNFPTDRNNIFANQSPANTARETTNFSNSNTTGWGFPSGDGISGGGSPMGNNMNTTQGGHGSIPQSGHGGVGLTGGMLPPTSIMTDANATPTATALPTTATPPPINPPPANAVPIVPQSGGAIITHVPTPTPMPSLLPHPNLTSPQTAPRFFADGFMGRLTIPAINLRSIPIQHGVGYDVIDRYIGHFPTTSAWDGNVGLASHNSGRAAPYFARIHELRIGDEIIYETPFGTRVYEVFFAQLVSETDFGLLGWSHENMITLVTCAGNVGGRQNQRLMVVGVEKS